MCFHWAKGNEESNFLSSIFRFSCIITFFPVFVPYMETLFDEDVLLGQGWTTYESLRPLAYSTLADLVHHVRHQLPMSDLVKAVHIFSKNVHDDTLPTSKQAEMKIVAPVPALAAAAAAGVQLKKEEGTDPAPAAPLAI
ncbi:unnamed protein product, partial [Nesidiocoris tenuis]